MDGFDRAIAIIVTFMVIVVIVTVILALSASLISHPIGTIVIIVTTIWLFRKIYPHVVHFMKNEGL